MRKAAFICIVTVLAILTGCREDRQFRALLDEVDYLMNTRPDSALALLQVRADSIGQLPESQRMRYHLLTAKAQNKAYVDFTTDSLMLLVTEYYDHHGTPNDRMMAHYLLGCCYRDMGEAPATIECYKDAVNQADTTQADCDFRTLMSIYGQMATLYNHQVMPMEELEALERSGWYALKCGDTIQYIKSIELKVRVFNYYEDSLQIFKITKQVVSLYNKYGAPEKAAQALPIAIATKLQYHKYDEAHILMSIFENQSGYFDGNGNIIPRYSNYYACKAQYYLGIQELDSAEIYLRKLKKAGQELDAYQGLIDLYQKKEAADSVLYYCKLSEDARNIKFTDLSTQSIRRTAAMYDYTRSQKIAYKRSLEAERIKRVAIILLLFIMAILGIGYDIFRFHRNKKRQEIHRITNDYLSVCHLYEKAKHDSQLIEHDFAAYREEMAHELAELSERQRKAQREFENLKSDEKNLGLANSEIVRRLKAMTQPSLNPSSPNNKDWNELRKAILQSTPNFYKFVTDENKLSEQELLICIMTKLGFSTSEQSILIDTTTQRITNAKSRINRKLFSDNSARSLMHNIASI